MNLFRELSVLEIKKLHKFPAFIAILAAFRDTKLDEGEKKAAIKYALAQTFTCDPLLTQFYQEVNKKFQYNIEQLDKDLPKEPMARKQSVINELKKIEKIILKLGPEFASTINRSMNDFAEHVSKSHYIVLTDFVIPLTALGLSD